MVKKFSYFEKYSIERQTNGQQAEEYCS